MQPDVGLAHPISVARVAIGECPSALRVVSRARDGAGVDDLSDQQISAIRVAGERERLCIDEQLKWGGRDADGVPVLPMRTVVLDAECFEVCDDEVWQDTFLDTLIGACHGNRFDGSNRDARSAGDVDIGVWLSPQREVVVSLADFKCFGALIPTGCQPDRGLWDVSRACECAVDGAYGLGAGAGVMVISKGRNMNILRLQR